MSQIYRKSLFLSLFIFIQSLASSSYAFDYLEHLYLTDRVCLHTTLTLERLLTNSNTPADSNLLSRYLALSLFCPQIIDKQSYCKDGEKRAFAQLTQLSAPPEESSEYSLTLGDLASLPDHIGAFGITPKLPRAEKRGLTSMIIEWITSREGGVTGTLYDVAEDACEGGDQVDWKGVNHDIEKAIGSPETMDHLPSLPTRYLDARSRSPLRRGPSDPAALYSFDNPHYLDLVFRNHHHFGEQAYSAWLGFHNVGIDLARSSCESLIYSDSDWLEDLADGWPIYDALDWDSLTIKERQIAGCSLLSQVIDTRLKRWSKSHNPQVINRLNQRYPQLKIALNSPHHKSELIHALVSSILSLVYEGSGLHFLQDSLAGGHMRTIRTRGGLQEARYDHDMDNHDGVIATYQTAVKRHKFIAYGDSYLLGPGPQGSPSQSNPQSTCNPPKEKKTNRVHGGRCALEVQRGLISLATMGSLLDWAYGGLMYPHDIQETKTSPHLVKMITYLRKTIPTTPPISSGIERSLSDHLNQANLPIPPPDFSYQVLSHRFGFDAAGSVPRLGIQLSLLDTLGYFAHWLSSYRFGLYVDIGDEDLNRWSLDAGYIFHFRWAARFTLDLGLSTHMGWRNFDQGINWYTGITPSTGITLLPEGWLKIPLEFTVNYQVPLTFYDQGVGFPGTNLIDGHYIGIGLGLAFMK
jgi:hypothetical protein